VTGRERGGKPDLKQPQKKKRGKGKKESVVDDAERESPKSKKDWAKCSKKKNAETRDSSSNGGGAIQERKADRKKGDTMWSGLESHYLEITKPRKERKETGKR